MYVKFLNKCWCLLFYTFYSKFMRFDIVCFVLLSETFLCQVEHVKCSYLDPFCFRLSSVKCSYLDPFYFKRKILLTYKKIEEVYPEPCQTYLRGSVLQKKNYWFVLIHSFPMHPFSTPWKQKTVRFSDVFRW